MDQRELSTKFALAIEDAISEVAKAHGGNLNAVLGALVSVQGYLLAGLDDQKYRQAGIDSVTRNLPLAIDEQRAAGVTARSMAVIKGGKSAD